MPAQPPRRRGKLIALEGLDGVGKTTQARLLVHYLTTSQGLPALLTREPTNGPHGQKIRNILIHGREGLTPAAELELFLADRREHVQQVIGPALAEGKTVITDRYYFSSIAYQGALGLDPREIQRRHEDFAPPPDLVIILELPLEEISHRLAQRGMAASPSFENIDYLAKVAAMFDSLAAPGLARVNGLGAETEVQARILALAGPVLDLPTRPAWSVQKTCLEVL
jgi:dTMP kinase